MVPAFGGTETKAPFLSSTSRAGVEDNWVMTVNTRWDVSLKKRNCLLYHEIKGNMSLNFRGRQCKKVELTEYMAS